MEQAVKRNNIKVIFLEGFIGSSEEERWMEEGPTVGSSFTCAKLPEFVTIFIVKDILVNLVMHISYADLSKSKLGWQKTFS